MRHVRTAVLFLVLAVLLVPALVACTPIPGQRPPSDGRYNGDEPDPRPAGIPAEFVGVRIHFYGHDSADFPKDIEFSWNILAHAFNPELVGGFVEPDTGTQHLFRDPTTKVDLLVEPEPKLTPYGFTVWMPPGEIVDFKIAYRFTGRYGDVVGCEFQTSDARTIGRTRTTAGVFNVRRYSDELGTVDNLCIYTVNPADLI